MTRRTELHTCQGNVTGLYYRHKVIEPIVVPYACRHGNAFIFQDDNARAQRAPVVQDHLQFRRIMTFPWPVKSPDLSPIEHWWDILARRVNPQDINELTNAPSRNKAGSLNRPLVSKFGVQGVAVSRAWQRLEALLAIKASANLIY